MKRHLSTPLSISSPFLSPMNLLMVCELIFLLSQSYHFIDQYKKLLDDETDQINCKSNHFTSTKEPCAGINRFLTRSQGCGPSHWHIRKRRQKLFPTFVFTLFTLKPGKQRKGPVGMFYDFSKQEERISIPVTIRDVSAQAIEWFGILQPNSHHQRGTICLVP